MSNPFKELESKEKVPPEVKKNVDGSVGLIKYIGNILDLFVGQLGAFFVGTIKSSQKKEDKEK